MKKILTLLVLSFLLTSCFGKKDEKVILDEDNKKIVEEVLDGTNTGSEISPQKVKTEEEAIKELEEKNKEEKTEEKAEEKVVKTENNGIKEQKNTNNKKEVTETVKVNNVKNTKKSEIKDEISEEEKKKIIKENDEAIDVLLNDLFKEEEKIDNIENEVKNTK